MEHTTIEALVKNGAHLVRCGADKAALDKAWQDAPWTGAGSAPLVAHIPGRIGMAVVDVDLAWGELEALRAAVVDALGEPLLEVPTPSGGVHLYYPVHGEGTIPNKALTVGDLRGDRGYAVLYGDSGGRLLAISGDTRYQGGGWGRTALLEALRPLLRAGGGEQGSVPRGLFEGDRHNGLRDRMVAAVRNDESPEEAVAAALGTAVDAGLPRGEVRALARWVVGAMGQAHEAERERRASAFSELSEVIERWRRNDGTADLAKQGRLARGALAYIEALVRGDPDDALLIMRQVAARHEAGGDAAVYAWFRETVTGRMREGVAWDAPAEPRWLVKGWIPWGRMALLYADGGLGKTRVGVQLALGLASGGGTWLPGDGEGGFPVSLYGCRRKVLFLSWEDTREAMARLMRQAAATLGIDDPEKAMGTDFTFRYMGGVRGIWAPRAGGSEHVANRAGATETGYWLREEMRKYNVVILDSLASIYGSDENQRGLVRAFINHLDEAAIETDCTVLVIGHSSKAHLVSGSTDWRNGVRCVLGLEVVERKVKDPADKRREKVAGRAVRLRVEKLNEARKPGEVWLSPTAAGGWQTSTRERSEALFCR